MISVLLYYSIISFIFIFIIHYLYEYFKNNLTIPKEKDLIEKPKHAYNKIYSLLQERSKNNDSSTKKMELKNLLKEFKRNPAGQKGRTETGQTTQSQHKSHLLQPSHLPQSIEPVSAVDSVQPYSVF